ncbi:response regulator transcription factor [Streptomyces sp. NPDC057837]|uniref:response regulator transcription factor n=1 Tax=Streptomyces sp. NPDC057837 TaxID=3346260 RepID=UPI003687A509
MTKLELSALQYVSQGLTYAEIGQRTGYSQVSVQKAVIRVLRKLNARNRAHAVFLACQAGILNPKHRHGDHAGFIAHQRRGEDPWECRLGCPEGERAYRRERRAARRKADEAWRGAVANLTEAS